MVVTCVAMYIFAFQILSFRYQCRSIGGSGISLFVTLLFRSNFIVVICLLNKRNRRANYQNETAPLMNRRRCQKFLNEKLCHFMKHAELHL